MQQKKKEHVRSIALVQGGLNEHSATDILIEEAARMLSNRGAVCTAIDVRDSAIDFWDGRPFEKYSDRTKELVQKMEEASGFVFCVPVYAAAISGAVKNIITHSRRSVEKKTAAIMACSSSGVAPYPAVHELIDLLLRGSHVATVQPVVYASPEEFRNGKIFDEQITLLIEEMIDALLKRCSGRG
ncbi:NAD(P)H-dependent oxidoreductase [Candidatus Uhrbacteria bacterium]|nr:NAD(P)H-dependent oxidoreductase [Candidatus Uhrbacteria bacterium]